MEKYQITILNKDTGSSKTVSLKDLLDTMYYNFSPQCHVSYADFEIDHRNEVILSDYEAEVLDEEATIEDMVVRSFEELLPEVVDGEVVS